MRLSSGQAGRRSAGGMLRVAAALAALLLLVTVARAQLLADVLVAAAIAAQFDSTVHFPSGSLSAVGAGADRLVARVPGHEQWTDWEVYTARGIAANLQPAFIHQLSTAFAVAGYFEQERSETILGSEHHLRILFVSDDGSRLLYLLRAGQEVVWLTARSR